MHCQATTTGTRHSYSEQPLDFALCLLLTMLPTLLFLPRPTFYLPNYLSTFPLFPLYPIYMGLSAVNCLCPLAHNL